jgi:hypothetical protein
MATKNTTSMDAHRDILLSRSALWSRGHRQSDGLQFVLFAGSTGQTYMTNERGCTCRGFTFRGQCAHVAAVKAEAEKAREKAGRRKTRYEDLFPSDDLEDAF